MDSTGLNRTTTYTYTTAEGETGLLASIADPLGRTVSYEYGFIVHTSVPYSPRTATIWVKKITEPGTATTPMEWTVSSPWANGTFTFSSNVPGFSINAYFDGYGRMLSLQGFAAFYSQDAYTTNFYEDHTNNLYKKLKFDKGTYDGIQRVAQLVTEREFGPHGNVLKEWYENQKTTHATTTTYYNASKYFQKESVTDALGRTSTFDYYDKEAALNSSTTTASAYDSQFVTPVPTTGNLTSTWKIKRPEFVGGNYQRVAFGWVTPSNQQLSCTINANGSMHIYRWDDCVSGTGTAIYGSSNLLWNLAPFASNDYWYVRAVWTPTYVKFQYSMDQTTWTDIYSYGSSYINFTTRPDRATISVSNGNSLVKSSSVRLLGYSDAAAPVAPFDFGAWSWLNAMGATVSSGNGGGNVKWVRDAGYSVPTSPSYNKQFTYTYNQYGQKASETNLNGVVTNFTYGDAWGNLTQVVQDPGTGHLNRTTTMAYDTVSKMTSSTDPNGQTSTFAYNTLGQPTSASFPAKTGISPAETISYTYGANGRTETVTDGRGTTSLSYESQADRLASLTDPVTGTTSYTYGVTSERTSMTLPGGGTVYYEYKANAIQYPGDGQNADQFSRVLTKITDDPARIVRVTTDGFGRLLQTKYNIDVDVNGNQVQYLQTDFVYDRYAGSPQFTHDWLVQKSTTWKYQLTTNPQSRLVYQNDYEYNDVGQRTKNKITTTNGSNQLVDRTELYAYDELSRLKTANYGDGQTQGYSFDAMGNANRIATRQVGSSAVTNYTSDANGNTLTDASHTNTWDSQNRMVSSLSGGKISAFKYGADGLRRKFSVTNSGQSVPTTITHFGYDGSNVVREWEENIAGVLSVSATYLLGPNGPMYKRPANATDVRWYVYDGLGSVVGEVDVYGVLQAEKKHDVYGLRRGTVGTEKSRHGFVGGLGHYSDDETGLIYMRARYYDPAIGRFISQDPMKDGDNWFRYCGNDPVNKVDPDGRISKQILMINAFIWEIAATFGVVIPFIKWVMGAIAHLIQLKGILDGQVLRERERSGPISALDLRLRYDNSVALIGTGLAIAVIAVAASYALMQYVVYICLFNDIDSAQQLDP